MSTVFEKIVAFSFRFSSSSHIEDLSRPLASNPDALWCQAEMHKGLMYLQCKRPIDRSSRLVRNQTSLIFPKPNNVFFVPKLKQSNLDFVRQEKKRVVQDFVHRPETLKGPLCFRESLMCRAATPKCILCVWIRCKGRMTKRWYLTTWGENALRFLHKF